MPDNIDSTTDEVTIGVPVVNELEPFKLAIKSIFAQTYHNWHLIIACDGSSPKVVETAKAIRSPKVDVIYDGKVAGLSRRLNQITEMSQTNLIARMDADDVMHPDRISKQVQYFNQNPSVDLVSTASWVIDEGNIVQGLNRDTGPHSDPQDYLGVTAFCHPTIMFTREWAMKYPYSEKWIRTEDKELWLRSCINSNFVKLEEPLLFYRIPHSYNANKRAVTHSYDRRLVQEYAHFVGAGPIRKCKEEMRIVAWELAGGVIYGLKMYPRMYKKKYSPLVSSSKSKAQELLAGIAEIKVSGWDD